MLTIIIVVTLIGIFGMALNIAMLEVTARRTNSNLEAALPLCIVPYLVLIVLIFTLLTVILIESIERLFPRKSK